LSPNATAQPGAFSPDCRWLIIVSDAVARVWDLAAEDPPARPHVLRGHDEAIMSVAISRDSHWILTVDTDQTARIWDLTAENPGASARILGGGPGLMESMAFSPDSRTIATIGNGTVRIWRWQWDDLVALASQVGRNFDEEEWTYFFPGEPYRKTFPELPIPNRYRAPGKISGGGGFF